MQPETFGVRLIAHRHESFPPLYTRSHQCSCSIHICLFCCRFSCFFLYDTSPPQRSHQLNLLPDVPEDDLMGGMEVCQPPIAGQAGAAQAGGAEGGGDGGGGGGGGDPGRSSSATPGHRDRTLVYSTVGTPDYIAPEVCLVNQDEW